MSKPYYSRAGIEIYHGDCREVLPSLPKSELFVTSPPYNCGVDYGGHDDAMPIPAYFAFVEECYHAIASSTMPGGYVAMNVPSWIGSRAEQVFAFDEYKAIFDRHLRFQDLVIWAKCPPNGTAWGNFQTSPRIRANHEWVLIHRAPGGPLGKSDIGWADWSRLTQSVWDIQPQLPMRKVHKATFPEELPRRLCLLYSHATARVTDPFCGTGTTLLAAASMGRSAVGIESNERYCEEAAKRIDARVGTDGRVSPMPAQRRRDVLCDERGEEAVADEIADEPEMAVGEERATGEDSSESTPRMLVKGMLKQFGSNTRNAHRPGAMLDAQKCRVNVVPFAGGMSELPFFTGRQRIAGDLHRHTINAARVIADPELKAELATMLDAELFHPDNLARSQRYCVEVERLVAQGSPEVRANIDIPDVEWAFHFMVASWMGRGGCTGKRDEFKPGGMSIRYDADGGSSVGRYRSMVASLDAMHAEFRKWEFVCVDFRRLLDKCKDNADTGIYADAPWVGQGKDYKHPFTERDHRDLAEMLGTFRAARVVVRYGDCPLVRDLYPCEKGWRYTELKTRNQGNNSVSELLITNFDPPGHQSLVDEFVSGSASAYEQPQDESTAPSGEDGNA